MATIHFSLADLVKQSAFQMCHLRKRPELKEVTPEQLHGNELALQKSTSDYMEMRGSYKTVVGHNELIIHYAFDEVIPDFTDHKRGQVMKGSQLYIEHKNIFKSDELQPYTVHQYIAQMAAYAAFNQCNPNRSLQTADFFVKEGNPLLKLKAKDAMHCYYQLCINDICIDVSPKNPQKIVDFFVIKAITSLDYETAKEYDLQFKGHTWEMLEPLIHYSDIPWTETVIRVLKV
jgi:hypothetical protein